MDNSNRMQPTSEDRLQQRTLHLLIHSYNGGVTTYPFYSEDISFSDEDVVKLIRQFNINFELDKGHQLNLDSLPLDNDFPTVAFAELAEPTEEEVQAHFE